MSFAAPSSPCLGVVIPLRAEARALLGRRRWYRQEGLRVCRGHLRGGTPVLAVCSGPARGCAAAAAGWLAARGVAALAVAGVAGALDPKLRAGDLLAGEGASTVVSWRPAALSVAGGRLLTVDRPILSAAGKRALFAASGAAAADQESAAVGEIAAAAGIPFMALRAICDPASRSVDANLAACLDARGGIRPSIIAFTLCRRPRAVVELVSLGLDFQAALRALRRDGPKLLEIFFAARASVADIRQEKRSSSMPSR